MQSSSSTPPHQQPLLHNDIDTSNTLNISSPFHRRNSIHHYRNQYITQQLYMVQNKMKSMLQGTNTTVLIYLICLLLASVGNSIYFKKMTNSMPNYPYFLSQLTTLVYVPVFFMVVAYEYYTAPEQYTSDVLSFPKYKFLIMGVFDSVAGVMALFGGVHTSGSTQALMNNAVIPFTMLLSIILLRERYQVMQYVGATIIMCGVAIVLLPNLLAQHTGTAAANNTDVPVFNILFFMANIPSAMSGVYKEVAFKDSTVDVPVNWLQSWVALFQMCIGFILIPVNTLSILGEEAISWSELPTTLINGGKCMIGIDSIISSCGALDELPCDSCSGAWIPLALYMVFNLFYNLFIVLVIKHGSAALMYLVLTLKLPIVQLAFTIQFINNPPDTFSPYSAFGLMAIISGLIAYRWTNKEVVDVEDALDGISVVEDSVANIHVGSGSNEQPAVHKHKQLYDDDEYNSNYTPPTMHDDSETTLLVK